MGRFYTAVFENVAVAAAQDFFEVVPASNKPIRVHQVVITNVASETSDQLRFTIKRVTGSPTSGSGGSTATPRPMLANDTAAGATVETNNTTRISGGTSVTLWAEGQNAVNGWNYFPTPEQQPVFFNGEYLIVGLEAAPAASTNMSGTIVFEELA